MSGKSKIISIILAAGTITIMVRIYGAVLNGLTNFFNQIIGSVAANMLGLG